MTRLALLGAALSLTMVAFLAGCGGGGTGSIAVRPVTKLSLGTPRPTSPPQPTAQGVPTVTGEPTVTASRLQIIDTLLGSGAEVRSGDTITVQYTGYLDDGTIFDGPAIHGGPVQFALGDVIKGWTEGVPGMKVGGKRRLIIPPDLAYGAAGYGDSVPPNATLTFDIEIVSIP